MEVAQIKKTANTTHIINLYSSIESSASSKTASSTESNFNSETKIKPTQKFSTEKYIPIDIIV